MRSLLDISSIHELQIRSIDFSLVFSQAYLDVGVFIEFPLVMGVDIKIVEWSLKLNGFLHGINQSSANWFDLLKTGLEMRNYHQSQVGSFVFFRKYSAILTYVYDCVIVSHKQETITSLI